MQTQTHQSTLGHLINAGTQLVQIILDRAKDPAQAPEPIALAFERVSRAVRRTIMLAEKLEQPRTNKRDIARKQIIRGVENTISYEVETPEDADALRAELLDRLDTQDADDDIDSRPIPDIIREIEQDMGLTLTETGVNTPRRTPEDISRLCNQAARRLLRPPNTHPRVTHQITTKSARLIQDEYDYLNKVMDPDPDEDEEDDDNWRPPPKQP